MTAARLWPSRLALGLALAWPAAVLAQPAARPAKPATGAFHRLPATPTTVAWGHYAANTPPVLRVASGDTIEVETLITSSPKLLEGAGVAPADVEQSLRDIFKTVTDK